MAVKKAEAKPAVATGMAVVASGTLTPDVMNAWPSPPPKVKTRARAKGKEKGGETKGQVPKAVPEAEKMSAKAYAKAMKKLHVELVKLQQWVVAKGLKVCIVFEGRDAAGKGGCRRRLSARSRRCTPSATCRTCRPLAKS